MTTFEVVFNFYITDYPCLNAPGGVTFCKKSAKRLHIILSISAWKKNKFGGLKRVGGLY